MSERVVVAMSGGVDSSVVAALMVQEGLSAVGVTLQLRPCDDRMASRSCCATDAVAQARAVAGRLGIPHYVLDCRDAFAQEVLRPAWEAYARGLTPSPCLDCNRAIKFGLLAAYGRRLGAATVASGHYARLEPGPVLLRGLDRAKDQSYFLSSLTAEQLAGIRLPLGALTKAQVRELARDLGLPTAERHESQDACLSWDGLGFPESLRLRFEGPVRRGAFLDPAGRVLGQHEGLHRYTVGMRRGLGIALGSRAHVVELRPEDASVVLSTDPADLLAGGLVAGGVHWLAERPGSCQVQVRSRHAAAQAHLRADGDEVDVRFLEPQRAVAPGQAVAFYEGDRVLGGGWIRRVTGR